jgi:putative nucleotidyltransferase with HDIG domain
MDFQSKPDKKVKLTSIYEEGLERRLGLLFGFMSLIPILIIYAWSRVNDVDLGVTMYAIAASVVIGYFFIARPTISSVLTIAQKVKQLSEGQLPAPIEVNDKNEIGELARSFNRITKELEHKIEELESSRQLVKKLLARIGTALNSYDGIDNLLNLIMENTAAALEAQMGSLMLVDGEKQELYLKTSWSNNGQTVDANFRVKLGEGIMGWVAKEQRAMRSTSLVSAVGFAGTSAPECATLSVPLQLRDHPIGVITVVRESPARPFTEDDEMLLGSIGAQVAVAIENYRLNLDVERTYLETILALALAVEAKDPYSAGHSKRVGFYASKIGEEMGLDPETLRTLNDAGILHDIGKIGIKDEILLKPGALTPEERKIMQQHSVIGEAIVKPVRSLAHVVQLVRHHHERFDGAGYPDGLKGDQIPLGARILAVADTYDAMVTDRPYRKRRTLEETKTELQRNAGQQHDPNVVAALLRIIARKEERFSASHLMGPSPSLPIPNDADPKELGCR